MKSLLFLVVLCCSLFAVSLSKEYSDKEQISIQVNNVHPFNNPTETYDFYSLPFCQPGQIQEDTVKYGDSFTGKRRKSSAYEIFFRTPIVYQRLCQFTPSANEIEALRNAIDKDYMFELFVDGLPVSGFIGDKENEYYQFEDHLHNETKYYVYTHLIFSIAYNSKADSQKGHVIAVNVTTNRMNRVELKFGSGTVLDFSYSANWIETDITHENRLWLHYRSFLNNQSLEIHWLSIINSIVLVVLLVSFLAVILMKVLKNDFARYMDSEAEDIGAEVDDSGWKQVHGDVFRSPEYPIALSAIVGTGVQLLALVSGLLFLSLIGMFYPGNSGTIYTAGILLYALTSGIAGFVSARLYRQMGGTKWATNAVLTCLIFSGPLLFVFSFLNSIALSYKSTSAVPFKTILLTTLLWGLVTFPLTIFGAFKGKQSKPSFDAPCKTNFAKREIPSSPWYRSWPFQMVVAGFLPFSAIYIELHYLFSAIWGHRPYTLFGILTLAFLLLIAVTSFITISLTYFQLAVEDWRWWWRSILCGGAAGGFIAGYGIFFFNYRTFMTGFMQSAFYFGYITMLSYAFFLMLGAVGFLSSLWFVRKIYSSIKSD